MKYVTNKRMLPKNLLKEVTLKHQDSASETAACQWGSSHEDVAICTFVANFEELHKEVNIQQPGLVIHLTFGYLRASPDDLLSCACCADEILMEVKCPVIQCTPSRSCGKW